MVPRLLSAALPLVLACMLAPQTARADIYTWVDKAGSINVSNLTPPDGVHVTNVQHEIPVKAAAPRDTVAVTTRDAEVQALDERIRELEYEVELARHPAPPPAQYYAPPAPPVVQYVVNVSPPEPASNGCDPSWYGCGAWWASGFYPASFFVLSAPTFRRPAPIHGGPHIAMQGPVRAPGGFNRR